MNTYITLDAGSCHMGDKDYALSLIDVVAEAKADAVKFQLGNVGSQNVRLPFHWWDELCAHADKLNIDIYASVFDQATLDLYLKTHPGPKIIKFAWSQRQEFKRMQDARSAGFRTIVSCGVMSDQALAGLADVKLFCIPEYPLMYNPRLEGLFHSRFDGFSDHSLGIDLPYAAVGHGAKYIEKHVRLYESECPDAKFALYPDQARRMVKTVRRMEGG